MPRKIVFINQATGYLTIDIINEFVKEFEEVALVTGSIRIQNTPLDRNVKICHIIEYNRNGSFRKLLSWLIGTVQIFFLLKIRFRNFEKFYFTIPPTAYLLALNFKSLYSILVFDIYPEALIAYRFSERGILYKWWSGRNRIIFSRAHKVFTLSEYMKTQILCYSNNADVRVISNWSAFSGLTRVPKDKNKLIYKYGLQEKFIVQYSGNIGATHNVEVLIEVADILKHDENILFLIIGRGKRANDIQEMVQNRRLSNCVILPFRNDDELYDSLCAADLSVIILDERTPNISVPSKTYNIMAAGSPIMVIASLKSELSKLVERHRNGKAFGKSDLRGMREFILELKNDTEIWDGFSSKSLAAAKNYTIDLARKYLEVYNE